MVKLLIITPSNVLFIAQSLLSKNYNYYAFEITTSSIPMASYFLKTLPQLASNQFANSLCLSANHSTKHLLIVRAI